MDRSIAVAFLLLLPIRRCCRRHRFYCQPHHRLSPSRSQYFPHVAHIFSAFCAPLAVPQSSLGRSTSVLGHAKDYPSKYIYTYIYTVRKDDPSPIHPLTPVTSGFDTVRFSTHYFSPVSPPVRTHTVAILLLWITCPFVYTPLSLSLFTN